jgi:hypothetical protein
MTVLPGRPSVHDDVSAQGSFARRPKKKKSEEKKKQPIYYSQKRVDKFAFSKAYHHAISYIIAI